ncbi:MAG: hypothetical protein MZW92_44655 [Comamonadaceae bacterium]|nr:hypothetical protein [Comamonadaceae bacterium]
MIVTSREARSIALGEGVRRQRPVRQGQAGRDWPAIDPHQQLGHAPAGAFDQWIVAAAATLDVRRQQPRCHADRLQRGDTGGEAGGQRNQQRTVPSTGAGVIVDALAERALA